MSILYFCIILTLDVIFHQCQSDLENILDIANPTGHLPSDTARYQLCHPYNALSSEPCFYDIQL